MENGKWKMENGKGSEAGDKVTAEALSRSRGIYGAMETT